MKPELNIACSICGAGAGSPCVNKVGNGTARMTNCHQTRIAEYNEVESGRWDNENTE